MPKCARSEMMYECIAGECKIPGCQNQRFRRRQYAQLEVFPTPGKGYGLRCATGEQHNTGLTLRAPSEH